MKSTFLSALALLTMSSSYAVTCSMGVCLGQKVHFSSLNDDYEVTKFVTNSNKDVIYVNTGHYNNLNPSDLYTKQGSKHIGKTYKVKNGTAKYELLAINLKNKNKFIGKLSTNNLKYQINLDELMITSDRRWQFNSHLDKRSGVLAAQASIKNEISELFIDCSTLNPEPKLGLSVKALVGRAAILSTEHLNEHIKVTITTEGKNSETYFSHDYKVIDENLIIKMEDLPNYILDSFISADSAKIKIESDDLGGKTVILSDSEFSLSGSYSAINKMQDTCNGIID